MTTENTITVLKVGGYYGHWQIAAAFPTMQAAESFVDSLLETTVYAPEEWDYWDNYEGEVVEVKGAAHLKKKLDNGNIIYYFAESFADLQNESGIKVLHESLFKNYDVNRPVYRLELETIQFGEKLISYTYNED